MDFNDYWLICIHIYEYIFMSYIYDYNYYNIVMGIKKSINFWFKEITSI